MSNEHNYMKKIQDIADKEGLDASTYDAFVQHDEWCATLGPESDEQVYCNCDPDVSLTKRGTMH